MTLISDSPRENSWLDKPYKYNEKEVNEILRHLNICEKFQNGKDEKTVKWHIIAQVKCATRLLKTSKRKDWPKVQNILSKDIERLELARTNYIKEITTFAEISTFILDPILFEATRSEMPIYTEAVSLNMNQSMGSLKMKTILEHMRRNDEYLSLIIELLPKDLDSQQVGRPKISSIVYNTVYNLYLVYAEITGDSNIGLDGPLQKFIEACLIPIDEAWKKEKKAEKIFIADEENDSALSVVTILRDMKKRKKEKEEMLQKELDETHQ